MCLGIRVSFPGSPGSASGPPANAASLFSFLFFSPRIPVQFCQRSAQLGFSEPGLLGSFWKSRIISHDRQRFHQSRVAKVANEQA